MDSAQGLPMNSDYPMDMVILVQTPTSSYPNADGFGGHSVTIPHGLPFIPLVFGNWSPNSDFRDPRDYGVLQESSFGYVRCYADSTNVYIDSFATNSSGTPINVYVRIFGFEPSNSAADIPPTNTSGTAFTLNSDYNYSKLLLSTIIPTASGSSASINHGLGYLPQIMAWQEYLGGSNGTTKIIEPYTTMFAANSNDAGEGVSVTTSAINIAYFAQANTQIHLRAYIDDFGSSS